MQRHFSNRGEALSEVTAARMLAQRKRLAESVSIAQGTRQSKAAQWFMKPPEMAQRPKTKQPKPGEDATPLM